MRIRKLRIAWSVFWGLVCILLISLWVRSTSSFDQIGRGMSAQGRLYLFPKLNVVPLNDTYACQIESRDHFGGTVKTLSVLNGQLILQPGSGPAIPYWPIALVVSVAATLPWIPRRFSLRTLLIATTLVAVVLGSSVWLAS
jgi:hypothetical protein